MIRMSACHFQRTCQSAVLSCEIHGVWGDVDTLEITALFNNTFSTITGAIDLLNFFYQNHVFTAVSMEFHRGSDDFVTET